ncbi:unnamed protein product [Microthlaspi erraticum]|uniref:Gnk2-homologous domain-containing protein n=1 Tax=Microthlaspi erraticum TaxID=1685480 RepID=A0A6D2IFT9_9BRAS|nr:unnamed protein product [Microthlaspi erraticum]
MDALTMISIMTLMLFSGSARAATLIVSNQLHTRGNVPVFVTCHGTIPKMSKSVPLGQVSLTKLITPVAGNNATDEKAGSRVLQQMSCVGTFYTESHFGRTERPYVLYDSYIDSKLCKNACLVVVKDDGFYRWNNDKNVWDKIPPIIWT